MDRNNPFATGKELDMATEDLGATGRVDLAAVFVDGTSMAFRNVLPIAGGLFIIGMAYIVSVCTFVGGLATAPFLLYGANRFMLSVVDGGPDFGALSSGVTGPEPKRVFLHGWGVILLLVVMMLPLYGVAMAVQVARKLGLLEPLVGFTLTILMDLVWSAVVAPLTYASYVWADRGLGPMASYSAAFTAFRPSWGALAALLVVMQAAMFPGKILWLFIQEQSEMMASASPDQALGMKLWLMLAFYLYLAVIGGISMCWMMVAYRQVVPPLASDALAPSA